MDQVSQTLQLITNLTYKELTNVARALQIYPQGAKQVKKHVLHGLLLERMIEGDLPTLWLYDAKLGIDPWIGEKLRNRIKKEPRTQNDLHLGENAPIQLLDDKQTRLEKYFPIREGMSMPIDIIQKVENIKL